jgi:hypothetical protein
VQWETTSAQRSDPKGFGMLVDEEGGALDGSFRSHEVKGKDSPPCVV